MQDREGFFVDVIGFGNEIDILPLAYEVIAKCPYSHDLTPLELAELTAQAVRGKYIPVDVQDRVKGGMLWRMTDTIIKWAQSDYRIDQIKDLLTYFPDKRVELSVESGCCKEARSRSRRFVGGGELERLPVPECWRVACHCQYITRDPKKRSNTRLTP